MGDSIDGPRQDELQARISAVHADLRRKYKESLMNREPETTTTGTDRGSGNSRNREDEAWEALWKEHTGNQNQEQLADYSRAMHQLATRIWDPRNRSSSGEEKVVKCRIEWVVSKCKLYFKEALESGVRLRLLDVGSCYNPFSKYENLFDILAIDLCPAQGFEDSVLKADFLQIVIKEDGDLELGENGRTLTSLVRNRFDLAVFSFFLEYLPNPKQRLESCRRVYKLLTPSGLLFILRPDSNSVTAAAMKPMKEMKVGMANIGFKRLWCEKLQHLWCTAYVKLSEAEKEVYLDSPRFKKDLKSVQFTDLAQLFSIPQDFRVEHKIKESASVSNVDPTLFAELPYI
jgi:SAM-dependent methyltransferase